MKRAVSVALAALACATAQMAVAQHYEYRQGYIFEQAYIQRISIAQAEQIASSPGLFAPLMNWEWGEERLTEPRVKRVRDRLVFQFKDHAPLSLRDYTRASSKAVEGDAQRFVYLRSTPAHHVVGVIFGHDQPAFLLVTKSGGPHYFVNSY